MKKNRIIAQVYMNYKDKRLWVNEYMRQVLMGKSEKEAIRIATRGKR